MPRGRPKKKVSLDDLPLGFRRPFIQFIAENNIVDVSQGLILAGTVLIPNSNEFNKRLQEESERKYRSRHFREQNKTITTVRNQSHNQGLNTGYSQARREFEIKYRCTVCNDFIVVHPNSDEHQVLVDTLYQQGWRHSKCA